MHKRGKMFNTKSRSIRKRLTPDSRVWPERCVVSPLGKEVKAMPKLKAQSMSSQRRCGVDSIERWNFG